MNKKIIYFLSLMLAVTVFTKEIGMYEMAGIQFDVIGYSFFIVAFLIFFIQRKIKINKWERIVFIVLLVQGVLCTVLLDLPFLLFLKQFIPIFIIYVACKNIIIRSDIYGIFQFYVYLSLIVSLIGLFQFVLKLNGILLFTDYDQLFIDSIALEPSHYVAIVLPAAVYLFEKKDYTWKFFIILASLILTFKLTFVASIIIYLLFSRVNKLLPLIIILPVVIYVFSIIIARNIEFSDRIENISIFYQTQDIENVNNLTSFSFASNLQVAINNFKNTFGLGVGLGGHETTYYRYYDEAHIFLEDFGMNAKSGHSLFIRSFSELGIISIILAFIMLRRILSVKSFENRAILLAAMSHFIVKSIKLGGYFDYGTLFFLATIIVVIKLEKGKTYLNSPSNTTIDHQIDNHPIIS